MATDRTTRAPHPSGGTAVLDEPPAEFLSEDEYWREHYTSRPYVDTSAEYETYRPAYRYGWEARERYPGREWDDEVEAELRQGWTKTEHGARKGWNEVREAVRDAWHRLETRLPGDADRDQR